MLKIFKYFMLVGVLIVCLSSANVLAGPVLNDPENWDSGVAGWANTTGDGALSNPDGYLQITFGDQGGGPPSYEEDTIFTSGADDIGNFQTNYLENGLGIGLQFAFFASNSLPLSTLVYFHSAGEPSTNYWQYAFDYTDLGTWTDYDVTFVYSGGWTWTGGASDTNQFWNDLADIDWVGVNIARDFDTAEQIYGLDDWEYYAVVPEPGSIYALATAFLSLTFVFRKRLKSVVADKDKS